MDNLKGTSTRLAENKTFVPDVGSNTQLVEQKFTMFKGYLLPLLEAKDKHLEQKSKTIKKRTSSISKETENNLNSIRK